MSVGLEVTNDSGVPVLVNAHSFVFFAIAKGTQAVASNPSVYGVGGYVSLPPQSVPYLVFIRCNGGSAQVASSTNGFSWNMAQGTTSFDWWAWGRATVSGSTGMQVFNPDGSIQWDMSNRPLRIAGLVDKSGASVPSFTEMSTDNLRQGPLFNGPGENLAYLMSDIGLCHDIYAFHGSGPTLRGNMRYQPFINTPNSSQLRLNYCRRRENRPRSLNGASYQSFAGQLPNFLIAAHTY
ncbi:MULTISPECIES: hypothetical protein [Stenotrophomonas]|jgi:hypothetical protein|uniref:hypothetical protein n=1 Tax=Stenotrophomonas TaxID=40323 RepID=UPI0015D42F7B|nr:MULTISPECIES: hypothetical protein [Stenotrophomonas]NYT97548.1 hypothetical protein [Stenotrophomonas sp. SbOxS2]WGV55456.1 hypothetical protein QIF44_03805 [Stenotrophomonas indicatrix]